MNRERRPTACAVRALTLTAGVGLSPLVREVRHRGDRRAHNGKRFALAGRAGHDLCRLRLADRGSRQALAGRARSGREPGHRARARVVRPRAGGACRYCSRGNRGGLRAGSRQARSARERHARRLRSRPRGGGPARRAGESCGRTSTWRRSKSSSPTCPTSPARRRSKMWLPQPATQCQARCRRRGRTGERPRQQRLAPSNAACASGWASPLALALAILLGSMGGQFLPFVRGSLLENPYLLWALATPVQFWAGWRFYRGAWAMLKHLELRYECAYCHRHQHGLLL